MFLLLAVSHMGIPSGDKQLARDFRALAEWAWARCSCAQRGLCSPKILTSPGIDSLSALTSVSFFEIKARRPAAGTILR